MTKRVASLGGAFIIKESMVVAHQGNPPVYRTSNIYQPKGVKTKRAAQQESILAIPLFTEQNLSTERCQNKARRPARVHSVERKFAKNAGHDLREYQ